MLQFAPLILRTCIGTSVYHGLPPPTCDAGLGFPRFKPKPRKIPRMFARYPGAWLAAAARCCGRPCGRGSDFGACGRVWASVAILFDANKLGRKESTIVALLQGNGELVHDAQEV